MIKRIIEISGPARLSLNRGQMVVERHGLDPETVPVEDIGVLILDNPCISHTQGLLSACFEQNAAVLVCDSRHLPAAIFLPFEANSLHSRVIAMQGAAPETTKKRLWKRIIRAKLKEQAGTLRFAGKDPGPLPALAAQVRAGDPDNIEARAAKVYWQKLFGPDFRRDRESTGVNALLNYGYSLIRGGVARAVAGAGLHPSLGIHHHNQYNNFCLADDLIEPMRPIVDSVAFSIFEKSDGNKIELNKDNRRKLLGILNYTCEIGGRTLPLLSALHVYAASIRKVILCETKEPEIPVYS